MDRDHQKLEGRSDNCSGLSLNGGCFPPSTVTEIIEYQNCFVEVTYDMQICVPQGGVVTLNIWNISWELDDTDTDCNALSAYFASLQAQGKVGQLTNEINALIAYVINTVETNISFSVVVNWLVIDCEGQNDQFTSTIHAKDCVAYCLEQGIDGIYRPLILKCGERCCKRTTQYCARYVEELEGYVLETVGTPVIESDGDVCSVPSETCLVGPEMICSDPCNILN